MNFRILNFCRTKTPSGKPRGNAHKKAKTPTLETTLSRSFFAVSAVLLLLSLGITMYYDITRQRKEVDSTISGLASYIASMPQVADMLQMGYPSDSVRQDLDSLCSNTANLNVVLICDKNGLRFYHTDRNTTGETVTDGDEAAALAGSPPYITTGYGSLGTQRRAFHSIQDDSGAIIGYVMASVFTAHLSDSQKRIMALYLTVLAFMLLVSLFLSRGVVFLLRGRLMGHEPEELLDIYIRQDTVLGSLEEGLVAADPSGRVLFANQAAADLLCSGCMPGSLEGKQLSALFPDTDFSRLLSDDDSRAGAEVSRELKKQPVQKTMPTGTDAEKAQESQVLADSFKTASVSGLISNVGSRTLLIKTIPIIRKDSMKGVLMVLNDRTEMLRMSDELSGTRATLDTLRAFNHEFMNKLHVILGYLQTGETKKAITFIMNSSLVSSQAVRETAERIRVSSICALIIGKMMHAAELGIRLSLSPDSICLEHDLLIPSEEMITAVGNLLENAVEELADPANAGRAIKEIKLSLFCRRDFNLIVCEDTGRGIRRELAEHICDKGVSTKGDNRGFGLFLIKDIAERRRGELTIETEEGEGTVITLTFTRKENETCIQ
ncbi:aTPase/histidine kinase/DNA gyrase B/HSP90 domain protein [Clostridium sp. CAG:149]|nr:aTPase/histidine kinase/DNA gyrase B/HSP90 domain protein [Clostridium sp. CAG:149]